MKELAKSSCVKKKKSPSQLRREKRRRDERKREASKAEEDIAEVSEVSVIVAKSKCDPCGARFNSEEELHAHSESDHKEMPSPEKERSIASCSDLQLTPIHMQRDKEKLSEKEGASSPGPIAPPPPSFLKCDYWFIGSGPCWILSGKTFNCESDYSSARLFI